MGTTNQPTYEKNSAPVSTPIYEGSSSLFQTERVALMTPQQIPLSDRVMDIPFYTLATNLKLQRALGLLCGDFDPELNPRYLKQSVRESVDSTAAFIAACEQDGARRALKESYMKNNGTIRMVLESTVRKEVCSIMGVSFHPDVYREDPVLAQWLE